LLFYFFLYIFAAYKTKPVQEINFSINPTAAWNKDYAVVPELMISQLLQMPMLRNVTSTQNPTTGRYPVS